MGNFISNLITRHTTAASYVMPRHRGRFEPQAGPAEAAPAYLRTDVPPPADPADDTPAAANALPERPNSTPQSSPHQQERDYRPPVPPAKRTVVPPETLLPLFTPPATPLPDAQPSSHNVQEQAIPGNYPGPVAIPGTVNNLFAKHPPPGFREANTPSLPPEGEQEQHAAARPHYFAINPPGQQGIAFTVDTGNNGKGSTVSSYRENHFSPDRNTQRSGQYSVAASAPQPVIKVSIGRIDVRAVTQPAAAKQGTAAKPAMSLDDFLKK